MRRRSAPPVSFHTVNKSIFCWLFSSTLFIFLCFLLLILLGSPDSEWTAEALTRDPKQEKVWVKEALFRRVSCGP